MGNRTLRRSFLGAIWCVSLLLAATPSKGEIVRLETHTGYIATAQLLEGDENHKIVLILHGFLQTRDFFTVRRLSEALHDLGYTVLAPNLTLGIDNRRQSLACEAIHTHSMEQDVAEIKLWTDWLNRRNDKPITLIGHSLGSLELFVYLTGESSPPVDQAILISLITFGQGPIAKENLTERQRALQYLAQGNEAISSYRLAYCNTYHSTAKNYLSYVEWDGIKTLKNLKNSAIKPTILLGGGDHRLGNGWLPAMKRAGADVIQISGADHFFDHEHEFDLVDSVVGLLER
jgi:pimeloyl-ACP methyl ester carboxylesterase